MDDATTNLVMQPSTLERALEYIGPDEMLEVTPDSIRLRKLPAKKPARRWFSGTHTWRLLILKSWR